MDEAHQIQKHLSGIWNPLKQDGIAEINTAISPATDVKDFIHDTLSYISAQDAGGVSHTIPGAVIQGAENFAYSQINASWARIVTTQLWANVPLAELAEKIVSESWTWDWNVEASLQISGGTLSVGDGVNSLVRCIDAIASSGFSSEAFSLQSAIVSASITADGNTAHGRFAADVYAFLQYGKDYIVDPELGTTGNGHIDYGLGISFALWF